MNTGKFVAICLFLAMSSVSILGGPQDTEGLITLHELDKGKVNDTDKAYGAFVKGCTFAKKAKIFPKYKKDGIEQFVEAVKIYAGLNNYDEVFKSALEIYEMGEMPKEVIDVLADFYSREQGDLFKDAYRVEQNEFAVLTGDSEVSMLGTDSIGECMALVLYNPESQTACLAHIDKGTTEKSIEELLESLPSEKFQATLVGGIASSDKDSIDNFNKIIRVLRGKHSPKILSIDDKQTLDKLHYKAIVVGKDGIIQKGIPDGSNDQQWLRDGLVRLEAEDFHRPLVKAYDKSFQHTISKITTDSRDELKKYRNKSSKEILDNINKMGYSISELKMKLPGFAVVVKGIEAVLQAEAEALEDITKRVNLKFRKPVDQDNMKKALETVLNSHALTLGPNSSAENTKIINELEQEINVLLTTKR